MFYQALAQIGGKGLMFFVYMLLARILGPALYGVFGYTLSSVQIISGVLFDLGLLLIVTRELSVDNDSIFRPALWLKIGGCIAGGILFLLLIPVLKFPLILAVSLVVWAMLNSFTDFYFCVFRAKNMMHGEAATMLSQRVFLLGVLTRRTGEIAAMVGMLAGLAVVVYLKIATSVAWTWYVLAGTSLTFVTAWLASFVFGERKWPKQA